MNQITTVLIVDDDVDDRLLFCEAIGEINSEIECIEASSGKDAISFLQGLENKKPSLIFLDIDMPAMNGWDTLKAIRTLETVSEIPVILYSSFHMTLNVDQELLKQFLFFWVKPDSYNQILDTLNLVLSTDLGDIPKVVEGVPGIFLNK